MQQSFNINHPLLFLLAGIAVLAVLAQSVVFLRKAYIRATELGFAKERLNKIILSSVLFSIAPAIAIGIGIITLSGTIGLPLPWLRLSVVGSIVYELSAAETAASAIGANLGSALTAQQFATIAWTMTIGITTGVFLIPVFCKKYTNSLNAVGNKDKAWGTHFVNAIFFGLIATFVGVGLSGISKGVDGIVTALVLLISAVVMCICGVLRNKLQWRWLNDYALPICMLVSMGAAIPLTLWLS